MSVGVGLQNPNVQFFDNNGDPLANGTVDVYQPGTTTRRDTYSDSTLSTPNANPVELDAAGRATIYLDPGLSYKIVVKDSGGSTIYTQDNLAGSAQAGQSMNQAGTTWTGRVTADTTQTPSVGASVNGHTVNATLTKAGSGTHAAFFGLTIAPPTINGGGATVTLAATLVVNGAPTGGATNYALVVQGATATSIFQGAITIQTAVDTGITFSDSLVTGTVAATITAYVGARNADGGFVVRVTSDDPLFLGSNNVNWMAVRPAGAIEFIDADVAHGMTDQATTTAYGQIAIVDGTGGAMAVRGFGESTQALRLDGLCTTATAASGITTGTVGPIILASYLKSGTTAGSVGAGQVLVAIRDNATTRFVLDSDGDSHQDVGTAWTNFDTHDDIQALEALAFHVSRDEDPFKEPIRQYFAESLGAMLPRETLEAMRLISRPGEDGHVFMNMSKLAMLHTGAIRQIGRQMRQLAAENVALRGQVDRLQARLGA